MRTKLVVLGELLFIGFIIVVVIVNISVPAIVISIVSFIWTILGIETRLNVSPFPQLVLFSFFKILHQSYV